jgi:hypothetical protein
MTLSEGTEANQRLLEHRVPRLGVAGPGFTFRFESSQARDLFLDIDLQPRGEEYDEMSQRLVTPIPRRSRRAGSASSMGRPSPRSISA